MAALASTDRQRRLGARKRAKPTRPTGRGLSKAARPRILCLNEEILCVFSFILVSPTDCRREFHEDKHILLQPFHYLGMENLKRNASQESLWQNRAY